jgi:hypothetical protein
MGEFTAIIQTGIRETLDSLKYFAIVLEPPITPVTPQREFSRL